MQALHVIGVRMEMPSNNPIVLLREAGGVRYLPIWVGAVEATAIAFAHQGVVPPRPLTHDLLKDALEATGAALVEIQITSLQDGVFYSVLVFASGVEVSARPSDAIALALRAGVPIYGAEAVLDEAGIEFPEEDSNPANSDTAQPQVPTDAELAQFREFLDQVSPEDFE